MNPKDLKEFQNNASADAENLSAPCKTINTVFVSAVILLLVLVSFLMFTG